jgi:hypothetical protein
MTEQWRNQFPENTYINTHIMLKLIKANSTPQDDIRYCLTWEGPQKKGRPKKEMCRKSIADHIKQSAKKKHRTSKPAKTPEEERMDLEGNDVKDGQEGKSWARGALTVLLNLNCRAPPGRFFRSDLSFR